MVHRPSISDEMMEKMVKETESEFNVPPDRVGFEHRIQVLIDSRRDLRSELRQVRDELEQKDARLNLGEDREKGKDLIQGL
jgi:hypothetical protein